MRGLKYQAFFTRMLYHHICLKGIAERKLRNICHGKPKGLWMKRPRTMTMNKAIKAAIAVTAVMIGSSSLMAAPKRHYQEARVQSVHTDSIAALPAKQFFERLQRESN
jgi:hypothetical protein